MRETWVQSLSCEDPLGMATHSSILPWRILMDRGAWWATVCGVSKSWTRLTKHSTAQNGIISISYVFLNSDKIRSVAQSCMTLCDPMNHSTPGLPVHHQLLEFTETHDHRVSDAIQPSHPLSSPSPLAPNPSQHQSLFQ